MGTWLTIRGYVAGVAAFIVCPCHLVLTLPLIIFLTAGTAVGAWLANNAIIIYTISFLLFLVGLALAVKWLTMDKTQACPIEAQEKQAVLEGEV